jgi:asparagine synthase (glutamine-hydrolysing)
MVRYIAMVWDHRRHDQHATAMSLLTRPYHQGSTWRVATERPGVLVLRSNRTPESQVHILSNSQGVVLGTLFECSFEPDTHPRRFSFTEADSASIVASGGQHLLTKYSGHYFAVIYDNRTGTSWVLRDPTGGIASHKRTFRGVDVYFSRLRDHDLLGMSPPSVNWSYVKSCLVDPSVLTGETGLTEIQELLAGQCVCRGASVNSTAFAWNPLDIAKTGVVDQPSRAVEMLRQTTRACVHAWASTYDGIVHRLSGGLDSSIVATCLRDAPTRPRVTCLNYYSIGSDTDERSYARIAAEACGFELIELERESPDLGMAFSVPRTPHPTHLACYLENGRKESRIARDRGASALFSGNAGDGLFYIGNEELAVNDYIFRRGIGRGLFSVALNAAYLERRSVWTVLWRGIKSEWLGRRWSPCIHFESASTLVPCDVLNDVAHNAALTHPLYREVGGVSSGKVFHAYGMTYCASPRPDPFEQDDDPDDLSPLFSQPLIELCLRIPIDILITGGRDRAIAREAFRGDLPPSLIRRRAKGGLEDHLKTVIVNNASVVRALLLDGQLASHGLIERQKVEEALTTAPTGSATMMSELYRYVSLEAWLQSWCGPARCLETT